MAEAFGGSIDIESVDSADKELRNDGIFSNPGDYYELPDDRFMDLSFLNLDGLTLYHNLEHVEKAEKSRKCPGDVRSLYLQHNRLDFIPENVHKFQNLRLVDLSNNSLTEINEVVVELKQLTVLIARNNLLGDFSLPKKLGTLPNLEELNLSGNFLHTVPPEILDVPTLRSLHLGGNQMEDLPRDINRLVRLEGLYLGGNYLKEIPAEVGHLHRLRSLVLCDNELQSLPSSVSCLKHLRSLSLHRNRLTTLPPEIVTLKGLVELSLRDNPLVVRFVQEMTYEPPSLRELAARSIKLFQVNYKCEHLPHNLLQYLESACRCVNPKCHGVYFDVHVQHIKFVDFCGKYRIPLLQYLCSPQCSEGASSDDEEPGVPESRMRRVLLG